MNKTPLALALALSAAVALGACNRDAYDQPENATADAPSTAEPLDTTAPVTPPTANDSSTAMANSTGNGAYDDNAVGTTGTENLDPANSAMGGTTTGGNSQYAANLAEELQRCDQLSGAERDTCRADAQQRYDQQVDTATPTTP